MSNFICISEVLCLPSSHDICLFFHQGLKKFIPCECGQLRAPKKQEMAYTIGIIGLIFGGYRLFKRYYPVGEKRNKRIFDSKEIISTTTTSSSTAKLNDNETDKLLAEELYKATISPQWQGCWRPNLDKNAPKDAEYFYYSYRGSQNVLIERSNGQFTSVKINKKSDMQILKEMNNMLLK
ncbi:MAG TPA: hypothetical protein VGW78_01950 [Candidatus Babeliales bacterium]|nr:hypothetical protein [Candidatus Babeliales bacterium]